MGPDLYTIGNLAWHMWLQSWQPVQKIPAQTGMVAPSAECTRCGGAHALSDCRWPLTEK
jgi:hypothetical protein